MSTIRNSRYTRIYETCLKDLYSDLDDAHGEWHINQTICNVMNFYTELCENDHYKHEMSIYSLDDVMIMMLFHDLGNSHTVWENTGRICKESEIRKNHHIISKILFDLLIYSDKPIEICGIKSTYLQLIITDDKSIREDISNAILNHRASRLKDKRYTLLDNLARCADGFNFAETILQRSIIYSTTRFYNPKTNNFDTCISKAISHLLEKYDINNGYACSLPIDLINEKYRKEIDKLIKYVKDPTIIYYMIRNKDLPKITELIKKFNICLN